MVDGADLAVILRLTRIPSKEHSPELACVLGTATVENVDHRDRQAAAGALEMTDGQRAELERLAHSHTAPAREVRHAKAFLWAAAEGTASVGRAKPRTR